MAIRWTRTTTLAILLTAIALPLGGFAAAARAGLFTPDCASPANAQEPTCAERRTQAHLARVAGHRAEALAALRLRVPSSEVRDDDVTVVFWEPIPVTRAMPMDPSKTAFLGGYWLGKDRACVLAWEAKANEIVSYAGLLNPEKDRFGNTATASTQPIFTDLRADDDATRRAFALLASRARHQDRPVVPVSLKRTAGSQLWAEYVDGWDDGCGHESRGELVVDPERGIVETRAHVD